MGIVMKTIRLSFFCILSLVAISCSRDRFATRYVEYVITAELKDDNIDEGSRTSMNTGTDNFGKVTWSETDWNKFVLVCGLFSADEKPKSNGITIDQSDSKKAEIVFSVTEKQKKALEENGSYILYGADADIVMDYGTPYITLSANQTFNATGGFAEGENPAVGYLPAGATSCAIKNLCGILKVTVNLVDNSTSRVPVDRKITSVRLQDNNIESFLAGQFELTSPKTASPNSNPELKYVNGSGGSSHSIQLDVPNGISGKDPVDFYFIVPPGTLSSNKGMNLMVYTDDGYYGGKKITLTNGARIERSLVTDLNGTKFIVPVETPEPDYQQTANCYIVPAAPGLYSIPAEYKGNGLQGNGTDDILAEEQRISEANSAKILWQTRCNGDGITATEIVSNAVYHKDAHGEGVITFHRSGIEGNALVAVLDEKGTVLWSWHIWIVDQQDKDKIDAGIVLKGTAGTIMDRNLGALSIDVVNDGPQTFGLAYQYGRKDPFMGSRYVYKDGSTSTYDDFMTMYPPRAIEVVNDSNFSIENSIKKPVTRVNGTLNRWCSGNVSWGPAKGSSPESQTPKTLYDPCPVGWRTIEESIIIKALGKTDEGIINRPDGVVVAAGNAFYFNFKGARDEENLIVFPAAGASDSNDALTDVGRQVRIWGATKSQFDGEQAVASQAISLVISLTATGSASSSYESSFQPTYMRATLPVRCVKWQEPTGQSTTGGGPVTEESGDPSIETE